MHVLVPSNSFVGQPCSGRLPHYTTTTTTLPTAPNSEKAPTTVLPPDDLRRTYAGSTPDLRLIYPTPNHIRPLPLRARRA